jgi:hypothetical protein
MSKPTCLWSAVAFGSLAVWGAANRRLERFFWFTLGSALAPCAFAVYFAAHGSFGVFWDDVFRRNMDYARAAASGGGLSSQASWLAHILLPLLIKGSWPFCALAAAGLPGISVDRKHRFETLVVVWLGTALAGLMAGFLFFPHYFLQALPPFCLACGMGVERLTKSRRSLGLGLVFAASLYPGLVFAGIYFRDPPEAVAKELMFPNPLYESYPIADYIRTHSEPSDAMYVFGSEPQLYVYAGRRAATEHITILPLTMYPRPREGDEELAKIEASAPKFVVYSTQSGSTLVSSRLGERFRDGIRALLLKRYRFIGFSTVSSGFDQKPSLVPAAGPPDWADESSLLLFELRETRN